MSDLIGRLRQYGPHDEGSAFRICDEAADCIDRQAASIFEKIARIEVLEAELRKAKQFIEELQAEVAKRSMPKPPPDLVELERRVTQLEDNAGPWQGSMNVLGGGA